MIWQLSDCQPVQPATNNVSHRVLRAVALLTVTILAGCKTAPSVSPAESVQSSVAERITAPIEAVATLDQTVTSPNGATLLPTETQALPDEVQVFRLQDAIEFGLTNSPRLKLATSVINRAAGNEAVAFAPFLPTLDLFTRTGVSSPNLSPGAPGPVGGILPSNEKDIHSFTQAELGLQWTIWDFGRTSGKYGQAVAQRKIADLQLVRAKQTVTYDVTTAYIGILLAEALMRDQIQAVARAESALHDAKAKRFAGVADRDDVLRAEVQLADAKQDLILAREMQFDAIAKLNYQMGRNSSLPLKVVSWRELPTFAGSLVDCLQTAANQRQEVGIAQEAVSGAQFGLTAAKGEFCPRIYILTGVGNVSGSGIRTGWMEGAGLHLDHKFYTGGRRLGQERMAEAEVQAAIATAQTVFDTISLEVNVAFRRVHAARELIPIAETAVTQATENLRLVRVKYKNGDATPTDVVDAETALTRSQQRFNSATYDYLTAMARLEYAMGTPQGCLATTANDAPALLPQPAVLPVGGNALGGMPLGLVR